MKFYAVLTALCLCAGPACAAEKMTARHTFSNMEQAAYDGKPYAQAQLGAFYMEAKQYEEALPWLKKAARRGQAQAWVALGFCYESGRCGEGQNFKKAASYYKKAARKNNPYALYSLGLMYLRGTGIKQNTRKGVKYLKRAAEKKSRNAWEFLASAYYSGDEAGIARDYTEAVNYWKELANIDDPVACLNLGHMYYYGYGVAKNWKEAFEWDLKAARLGLAAAQYQLGLAYLRGEGVEQDGLEGVKWLQKAADQGYEKAHEELNNIEYYVYKGNPSPVKNAGKVLAPQELERKARAGDAAAQYMYGTLCADVLQKTGNNCQPLEWYQKAAAQGFAPALARLAAAYYEGEGVPKDERKAAQYFLQAAEKGDVFAQLATGINYEQGAGGLPKNLDKAEMWYKRGAQKGDPRAKTLLGNFYVKHAKDDAQGTHGLDLLEEAAGEGLPRAQYLYGAYLTHLHPQGSACWEKGAHWLEKAAQAGNEDAKEFLQKEKISLTKKTSAGKDVKCAAPAGKK